MSKLMTINEVAEVLNLSESKVRGLIRSGDLESRRIGRAVRVPSDAVEDVIRGTRSFTMSYVEAAELLRSAGHFVWRVSPEAHGTYEFGCPCGQGWRQYEPEPGEPVLSIYAEYVPNMQLTVLDDGSARFLSWDGCGAKEFRGSLLRNIRGLVDEGYQQMSDLPASVQAALQP
jgi:excisionase family DNA binding protein